MPPGTDTSNPVRSDPSRNRLSSSQSPYLLQHAHNPVNWQPWDKQAFDLARSQNKPIFLSIGYSTCHWCHVMAHECFEDGEVAALLNRDYVSVKVDREVRPDIDQIYMEVCQKMTGSGGWPLTIFMTPDALPFYAATFIPKHGRYGRVGLVDLLPLIADKWRSAPDLLIRTGRNIVDSMKSATARSAEVELDDRIFSQAVNALRETFDQTYGGFGPAPKFPRPHDLSFLLQRYAKTGEEPLLEMVVRTLVAMRCGGIYDHLGFGFHRYAVDAAWLVPHFEKMLYDQAGLLSAYLEAYQVTGRALFAQTAREIVAYLKRDLLSEHGAFFSAEDADSEGVEGKYYVWTEAGIKAVLGEDEARFFNRTYRVEHAGNFHDEASGEQTGANILHLMPRHLCDQDLDPGLPLADLRRRLFEARGERIRPHLDDKIVTAWNGMVISGLANAGRILEEPQFLDDADRIVSFIMHKLTTSKGRLLRCYREGASEIRGFAEDYAFLIRGLLDLYAAGFRYDYLLQAIALAGEMSRLFLDEASGVLYDTALDADSLVIRPRSSWDGATPAASSIALEVFVRLSLITGDSCWRSRAEGLLDALAVNLVRYPSGFTQLLQSVAWLLEPTRLVVIAGSPRSQTVETLLSAAKKAHAANTEILFRPEPLPDDLQAAAPYLEAITAGDQEGLAFVCSDFACQEPLAEPKDLERLLQAKPPY